MSESQKLPHSSSTALDTATADGVPTIEKRFNFWTALSVAVCTSGAICIACMACWAIVNIFAVRLLHYMNTTVLVLHVVGFVVVIGVLLGFTKDKHDAAYVFTNFENHTGWNNNFVSWSIGLLSALYAYNSLDTVTHFCEEIPDANILVPRAMVLQAGATALMTFPFIIAVLFCIGDVGAVLASPIGTMSPFTQILINSTSNIGLSCFLNCISSVVAMTAGFDVWGAASRSIWSMARDNALPGAFVKLHPRLKVPVLANLVLLLPSIVVFMIYIWNTTAFYGIMAGVLVAFQLSYVLPIGINIFYTCSAGAYVNGQRVINLRSSTRRERRDGVFLVSQPPTPCTRRQNFREPSDCADSALCLLLAQHCFWLGEIHKF
ncbi:GABA permease [Cordyceps javanica]|nr:GABA permease [Cordyceps javanica]